MFIKIKTTLICLLIVLSVTGTPMLTFAESTLMSNPVVTAESAIMIDAATGIVLYAKNPDEILYPASMTKIMTALLLLEYVKENAEEPITGEPLSSPVFDERIIFSHYAVYSIEPGSSHIAMDIGETLSVREALYAIMLPSANEVSVAIAEFVSGTEEAFAKKMTARAKALGSKNTNFANPHGLTNKEHYTTSHDMALILREAIKHEEFVEVISTKSYIIPPTEKQPEPRYINLTNRLIKPGEFYYEYAVGGKTGYTDEARHTLAQYGAKDGIGLITVVMKADKNYTYYDTTELMKYGFNCYKLYDAISSRYFTEVDLPTDGGTVKAVVTAENGLSLMLPNITDFSAIDKSPSVDETVSLPVKKGDYIGVLNLTYDNNVIGSVKLIAKGDIAAPEAVSVYKPVTANKTDEEDVVAASTTDDPVPENKNNMSLLITIGILATAGVMVIALVGYMIVYSKRMSRRAGYRISKRLYK